MPTLVRWGTPKNRRGRYPGSMSRVAVTHTIAIAIASSGLGGCSWILGFDDPMARDGGVDGPDAPPQGPFGEPTRIDELSSDGDELQPSLRADGLEIYFTRDNGTAIDIWRATWDTAMARWNSPAVVVELMTAEADYFPRLSPDGLTLHFVRGLNLAAQIYVTTRATPESAWSTPAMPVAELNSGGDDYATNMDGSKQRILLTTGAPLKVYEAVWDSNAGKWGGLTAQMMLNNPPAQDVASQLVEDGKTVYLNSNRGIAGNHDIYMAQRPSLTQQFGAAVEIPDIPGVNTALDDMQPWMSSDGNTFVFSRGQVSPYVQFDLYQAKRQ